MCCSRLALLQGPAIETHFRNSPRIAIYSKVSETQRRRAARSGCPSRWRQQVGRPRKVDRLVLLCSTQACGTSPCPIPFALRIALLHCPLALCSHLAARCAMWSHQLLLLCARVQLEATYIAGVALIPHNVNLAVPSTLHVLTASAKGRTSATDRNGTAHSHRPTRQSQIKTLVIAGRPTTQSHTRSRKMRYTHFAICLAVFIARCVALRITTTARSEPEVFRRVSSSGSTSPPPSSDGAKSPPRHSVRLFGVNVTPGVAPAAHHAQTQHTHPVHTTQGHHTQAVHPNHATSSHPGQGKGGRSSAMYTQWAQGLSGDLAKSRTGPRPKSNSPDPQSLKRTRRPPGTHPRYEDQRRYREEKKAQIQGHQSGKPPSEHHDHHPQGGGGGRGPGSPGAGAGTHAVFKRSVDHSSMVPGL